MKKLALTLLSILLLIGCGYVPSAKLARDTLGEKVHVEVAMSRLDPQNTVLIKDAIALALVDRFGVEIVDKNEADSAIFVELLNTNFKALAYDINGYVISYRAEVRLKINYDMKRSNTKGSMVTKGEYDFPIVANSVISDAKRFEAIKFASEDAIDEFLAVVAIRGLQDKK